MPRIRPIPKAAKREASMVDLVECSVSRSVKKVRSGTRLARRKQWVRSGPDSLPESNSAVVNPNLHVWCFRVAPPGPSLYGATEGSASEAADVRLEGFGLSRGLSAAAESAFPEGAIASILRDASGGRRASEPMLAYA